MSNPTGDASAAMVPSEVKEQSKNRLREFFRQPLIKKSVGVLVPGVLAAALFPVFGPLVAAPAAAVAIQNALKLLGISLSDETTKKLVKPLEGKQIDESDLVDVLEEVLPKDEQVNDETAKALVSIVPDVKDAALANTRLNAKWLQESLESNMTDQGGAMAVVAPKLGELIQLDPADAALAIEHIKANWSRLTQSAAASDYGKVSNIKQRARGNKQEVEQIVSASGHGEVTGVEQDYEQDH